MLLDCNFPLYELRGYTDIHDEGIYRVVQTPKTRWVLDYVDEYKTDELYENRRIQLKTDRFRPYELYPLYTRMTTPGQVLLSRKSKFIDKYGKILTYIPSQFCDIEIVKISYSWRVSHSTRAYKILPYNRTFISYDGEFTHLAYVKLGKRFILVDLIHSDKLPEYTKKRKKL